MPRSFVRNCNLKLLWCVALAVDSGFHTERAGIVYAKAIRWDRKSFRARRLRMDGAETTIVSWNQYFRRPEPASVRLQMDYLLDAAVHNLVYRFGGRQVTPEAKIPTPTIMNGVTELKVESVGVT